MIISQSRRSSLAEAGINIIIGFTINYIANLVILRHAGFKTLTYGLNFEIGLLYTVISLVRQYSIRRWFNAHIIRLAQRIAHG